MKRIILGAVFTLMFVTVANAKTESSENFNDDCYEAAGAYIQTLNWEAVGDEILLALYDLMLDQCDVKVSNE